MAYNPSVTFEFFNQRASFSIIIHHPMFKNMTGVIFIVHEKRFFALFGKYRAVIKSVSLYYQAIEVGSFELV